MTSTTLPAVELSAAFNAGFGLFHLAFWRVFRWKEALQKLDHVNRAVMQILNLRLTYVFVLMAVLMALIAAEDLRGALPALIIGGMALFWLMRAFEQIWFFGLHHRVSISFTCVFALGAALHALAAYRVWD